MPHTTPAYLQIIPDPIRSRARPRLAAWAAVPANDPTYLPVVRFERERGGWNSTIADEGCDFHGRIIGR